jgi:hypothetical protein
MAHQVRFFPSTGSVPGKLADAELHFDSGILAGLKLVGFAVWERKAGGRNVTMPARQYSVNGERRSFALVRPIADAIYNDALRDVILTAYAAFEAGISVEQVQAQGYYPTIARAGSAVAAPVSPLVQAIETAEHTLAHAEPARPGARRASAQIAGW